MTTELEAQRQAEIDATQGMQRITVGDLIKGTIDKGNRKVFIWARGALAEVGYIRNPSTDPWVVCPKENAGFGLSYCVHYGDALYLEV